MKRTVIENTSGLWEKFPRMDIDLSVGSDRVKKDYSCFYEISLESQTPLWEGFLPGERPLTKLSEK